MMRTVHSSHTLCKLNNVMADMYNNYIHTYIYHWLLCIHFIVPAPNVTINVLSDDQSLRCDVTTVMGINRSVDILWMKDDTEVLRESDAAGDPINNATLMLYRSHYHYYRNVSANTSYRCQAIINTSPVVNNSDSYNLHVIGECITCHVQLMLCI